jgi:eukaryotic-like serine/threonine-protein kinase
VKGNYFHVAWWVSLALAVAFVVAGWVLDLGAPVDGVMIALFAVWLLGVAPRLDATVALRVTLITIALSLSAELATDWVTVFPALYLALGQLAVLPRRPEVVAPRPAVPRPAPAPPKPVPRKPTSTPKPKPQAKVPAKRKTDPEAFVDPGTEHRLQGLELQAKGDLDGALEAYRRCPLDDNVLPLLYQLAQSLEAERRFDRAAIALGHIATKYPDYKDVKQRIRRAELMVETSAARDAAAAEEGRLRLGRYEIQNELGKGAMGVVYLGRDPTIGRVVAIKTMQLDEEFDPDELKDVKERFFREAETAGRLAHPHIVTIYDAGEAHGLAWIAMEMLRGHDLNRHARPDTLLPVTTVVEVVAQAAEALDYAHNEGVIHRDVKPANLVYDRAVRAIKITDFGIARITDSTKTRIGLVLGTPSYMSPEQLGGKKLDGRSDIFSLGVTMYQLLTGQLPFKADSMAALVKLVASEEPPPVSAFRADLPDELDAIVARTMAKKPEDRYQRAGDLARALRALHSEEGDLWV